MSTTLYRTTPHPPDIEDRQVLQIPAHDELRKLAPADRVSFRIGLWLLRRAQRVRPAKPRIVRTPVSPLIGDRHLTAGDSFALLAYDLQRQLR